MKAQNIEITKSQNICCDAAKDMVIKVIIMS